jgi:hypothetical protein
VHGLLYGDISPRRSSGLLERDRVAYVGIDDPHRLFNESLQQRRRKA